MGYSRAGFEVVGVDIAPQRHYPFEFHQGDAIEFAKEHAHEFDVIHASPPCQVHSALRAMAGPHRRDLIPQTREVLVASGLPYVIENVPGAPLEDPVTYCATSFRLDMLRHRNFESNVSLVAPACDHDAQAARSPGYPARRYHSGKAVTKTSPWVTVAGRGLGPGMDVWRAVMGIDWMTWQELPQAIPPAYTEHIGHQLLEAL